MRRRTVTKNFRGKERPGPFSYTFSVGDELVLLHYGGENDEQFAVFARLTDVQNCALQQQEPSPRYEASKDLFDSSTAEA